MTNKATQQAGTLMKQAQFSREVSLWFKLTFFVQINTLFFPTKMYLMWILTKRKYTWEKIDKRGVSGGTNDCCDVTSNSKFLKRESNFSISNAYMHPL